MIQKYDPINTKYIYRLIISNAIIVMTAILSCLFIMYNISLTENENRLKEIAQNQARMIEAISSFDYESKQKSTIHETVNHAWSNTLRQLKDAHSRYEGFGKTGEFTLAKRVGDEIVFLLSHRHYDLNNPKPVKIDSKYAEPMLAALSLKSGVMVGIDYRGEKVVAAFEPVHTPIGSLGIVAKIDLKEIQEPFLLTGSLILFVAIILILWVSLRFFRFVTPIIKQQKQSVEALQKNQKLLSSVFDNTSIYIVVLNHKGNIVQFNDYAIQMTGYTKEEVMGQNWFELFIENKQTHALKKVFSSLVKGESNYLEHVSSLKTKDNSIRTIRWKNSFYELENKQYILSAGIDITENLELEIKYRNLYKNMSDGYGAIDLAGNIIDVNSSMCEMIGYSKEELLSKTFTEITAREFIELEETILSQLGDKESTPLYEKEYIHKDGSRIPVELRVSKLQNSAGNHIGYWAFIRDITSRKAIAAELHAKDEMMISQSRQVAMGDMVAMIAHQWRQPITTVTMVANNILMDLTFEKEISNDNLKEEMEKITHQTEYLSKTIDDFRNFFHPSNNLVETSLCNIFDDTLKIIGKSLENHNIKVDVMESECVTMKILNKEMLQVLLVVLNNAKDAIVNNDIKTGRIEVRIGVNTNTAFISICDNGGGIPEDILSRLGEPYLTTKVKHGTGLGLYMANIIIENHLKGTLKWYNNGSGACLEIKLPIHR